VSYESQFPPLVGVLTPATATQCDLKLAYRLDALTGKCPIEASLGLISRAERDQTPCSPFYGCSGSTILDQYGVENGDLSASGESYLFSTKLHAALHLFRHSHGVPFLKDPFCVLTVLLVHKISLPLHSRRDITSKVGQE